MTLDPRLDALVDVYPFKPYRQYRVASRRVQTAVLQAELERVYALDGVVGEAGTDDTTALAIVRPLAWDSTYFGLSMARIEYVLRGTSASSTEIDGAVGDAVRKCRAAGIRHLSLKLDSEDAVALEAAQAHGFRLMDTLLTYFTHPRGPAPTIVREVGTLRPFQPSDADELLAITREAYTDVVGRFQRDPHLPAKAAADFYLEWARQCLAGRMADRIDVAEASSGALIGWASVRRVLPFSDVSSATLWAGSLGACRRDAPGAYAGLIRRPAADHHARGEITETQTPASNIATANIYEAVGARFVRADYTLHAWLG